jgi:hypothetical protein
MLLPKAATTAQAAGFPKAACCYSSSRPQSWLIKHQFDGTAARIRGELPSGLMQEGIVAMLEAMMLRGVLAASSTTFGSLGVFCDCMSFVRPALAVYAVVFLTTAMAILRAAPQNTARP